MNHYKEEQINIPTSYIDDKELALDVAYAEKEPIEAAQKAMKEGLFSKVSDLLAKAAIAGKEVSRSYVNTKERELTSERRVAAIIDALAERYNLYPEDFSVVSYKDKDGKDVNTVIYNGLEGLDLGDPTKPKHDDKARSYKAIMADISHVIEVDGELLDARAGMTKEAYEALVRQKLANGQKNLLPDSKGTLGTGTWLTGERVEVVTFGESFEHYMVEVPCARVYGDEVHVDPYTSVYSRPSMRFRPAVVVN